MSLYRRGRIWYFDFELDGIRHKGSTRETSKVRARDLVDEKRRQLLHSEFHPVVDMKFKDFAKKYLEIHAAHKKGRAFFEHTTTVLERHFDKTLLSRIGAAEVDAFMAKRRAEVL